MTMVPAELLLPLKGQTLAYSTTATHCAADLTENTVAVELYATQAVHLRFGPTTTVSQLVTTSGVDVFIELGGKRGPYAIGSNRRISAIRDSADGVLRITELVRAKPSF